MMMIGPLTNTKPIWQERKQRYPKSNDGFAAARVAATFVAMAFLGPYFVLLFYLLWISRIYHKGKLTVRPSKALVLPVLIISYATASTLWSAHPEVTARAALEFASMIAFTLIIARTVSIPAFIKGITVGASVALVATIVAAGGIPDDLAQVGALGSKNQVGEIAEIGLYCAILSWSLLKNPPGKTAFSVLPFMLCTICLYFSRSATSDVSLAAMLGISATIYIIARMPQKIRAPVFILAIICISALAIAATAFDWKDAGLKAVGKDSTLTGRTLLWSEGIRTAMQSPIFGVGQWAFWVPGTPEAEKLWFQFDITGRSGFHFHNLFINLLVEVGLCGCILWSLAYLTTCVRATGYLLKHGTSLESMFYVGMLYMYLVRALTEVDTATPYGFAPLIFFYVVMRVAERKSGNQAAPEARLPSTRRLPSGFLQINTGRR